MEIEMPSDIKKEISAIYYTHIFVSWTQYHHPGCISLSPPLSKDEFLPPPLSIIQRKFYSFYFPFIHIMSFTEKVPHEGRYNE